MSDFLLIGGTRVPIAAPSGADEEYQEIGGEVVRSYSGRLLSTVKGRARVWRLQTPPLPESEAQMLAAVLAHGSPLMCSGALIGSDPVSCYARGVRTRPVAPLSRLRRVVEFELHEAVPAMSPILFRLHAGAPLPPGASFSHPSPAWYWSRDGVLEEVAPGVLPVEWLDRDGDGRRETPVIPIWPSGGNQVRHSSNFAAAGTSWSGASLWEITEAPSIIAGQTAWRHTAVAAGDHQRTKVEGVLTGSPETLWAIVEQVDASSASLQLWDNTASAPVCTVALTYATGTAVVTSGAGTPFAYHLGGRLWLFGLTATGTAGSSRRVTIRPIAFAGVGASAIVHHVQLDEAPIRGPLVVTGSEPGTYQRDLLTADVTAQLAGRRSFAIYQRFEERGTIVIRDWARALSLESDGGTLRIWAPGSGAATYEAFLGIGFNAKLPSGTPALRQTVEHLMIVAGDGTLTLAQSIDGGPVVTATGSHGGYVPTGTVTLAWGSTASGSNHGALGGRDLLVLDGSHWTMDAVRRLVR